MMLFVIFFFILGNAPSSSSLPTYSDPRWNDSWYLHQETPSMRIQEAWELGYSGKGVQVLILDSGIDRFHPDLYSSFHPRLSYDFLKNESNPHVTHSTGSSHGTNVAGVIAATGDNGVCSVGIAPDSLIGMGRILNAKGSNNDSYSRVRALQFGKDKADLIVMSFGPSNRGVTVGSEEDILKEALYISSFGRKGKGNILMLASGNGGYYEDSCSFDAVAQSIYTISVNAVKRDGGIPLYAEKCSAVMISAFGSDKDNGILTTTLEGGCVSNFTGTSSSNAVASGAIALALQANPELTWRDVQHLLARSVGPREELDPRADWTLNAAGFTHSTVFGFGLLDTRQLIERALPWKTVSPQIQCDFQVNSSAFISKSSVFNTNVTKESCAIRHLEHVQIRSVVHSLCRGNINMELLSPKGTPSKILEGRKYDFANTGFRGWSVISLGFWGETPMGSWGLRIYKTPCLIESSRIYLESWRLILYGTETDVNET